MLNQRLQELRAEYARGQVRQQSLLHEQQALHETMLRIAGAIQVLQELLAEERHAKNGATIEAGEQP
jgi:hypothetical protein